MTRFDDTRTPELGSLEQCKIKETFLSVTERCPRRPCRRVLPSTKLESD